MRSVRRIRNHLLTLYGETGTDQIWPHLVKRLEEFRRRNPHLAGEGALVTPPLNHQDAFLITYGDQIRAPAEPPLKTLARFLKDYLGELVTGVHLLPFYLSSSDEGFAVIDYRRVNPVLGDWKDIARIARRYRLMCDAVVNHVSARHAWFSAFLQEQEAYRDFFITAGPDQDLSPVVRPRNTPLLTPFDTPRGTRHLWTTFSADQIDLNYANPRVLLEMITILLFYVEQGAQLLRLDAIAYLWKEIGTACIHLPQTHRVVQVFRSVLDAVAPEVLLLTETNIPQEENLRYLGGSTPATNEAQLVYNFPLAPLILHAFRTGRAGELAHWVADLKVPPGKAFLNVLATHDGIGLLPARGLLAERHIQTLIKQTRSHGGAVSRRQEGAGGDSVYELNITFFDALNNPHHPQPDRDRARFLASQIILLSLAGVPGIYIHSLFGSRNFHRGMEQTGEPRTLNREKFRWAELVTELNNPHSAKSRLFTGYKHLLKQRRRQPAFHPYGEQLVLSLNEAVFALLRRAPQGGECLLSLVNVSQKTQEFHLDPAAWGLPPSREWYDLIGSVSYPQQKGSLSLALQPYQGLWLKPGNQAI